MSDCPDGKCVVCRFSDLLLKQAADACCERMLVWNNAVLKAHLPVSAHQFLPEPGQAILSATSPSVKALHAAMTKAKITIEEKENIFTIYKNGEPISTFNGTMQYQASLQ